MIMIGNKNDKKIYCTKTQHKVYHANRSWDEIRSRQTWNHMDQKHH